MHYLLNLFIYFLDLFLTHPQNVLRAGYNFQSYNKC